jgi:hypothetical protein
MLAALALDLSGQADQSLGSAAAAPQVRRDAEEAAARVLTEHDLLYDASIQSPPAFKIDASHPITFLEDRGASLPCTRPR